MPRDKGRRQVGEGKGKQATSDNTAVATTPWCWLDTAAAAIGPRCWPARQTAHTDAGAKQDLALAVAEPPSNWTEAGTWYWGGSPGPFQWPSCGGQRQEVAISAWCECGSGAARRRALRGPCVCSYQ
jgi:hypothetical protein